MTFESKDFSFAEGEPVNKLYEILNEARIKPNLTQNGAISLSVCMDDIPEKIEKVAMKASSIFEVQLERELTLLTIRHYTDEYLGQLTKNKIIVLQQKTPDTVQTLMSDQSIT
jgi:aspartate kinase